MSKLFVLAGVLLWLLLPTAVKATPALDVETQPEADKIHETQASPQPTPTPTPTPRTVKPQPSAQAPAVEATSDQSANQWEPLIEAVQNRLQVLEAQAQRPADDQSITNWLTAWWQVGFWGGVLLLFPWIFVGWQWTRKGFWGFGWPWPWWFWVPLWWLWPWLFIGWWWWLDWWEWWGWLWWLWPWLFWLFWWVIVFKELMISHWHRRGPEFKETGDR